MKHKFLTVLLAIIAVFCLCFGLAACGDTPKDPAGGTQTEQGSTDGSEDDGGDKETEGDKDDTPDGGEKEDESSGGDKEPAEGGSEGEGGSTPDEGGDQEPEEGGGQGSENEGGNTPEEGGGQEPEEGGQGGSEDEGGNTPEEGGGQEPEEGGQGGDEHTSDEGGEEQTCSHQYTAENVCSLCGDEWEYTEGLRYELDKTTDTYAIVQQNRDISGDIVIPYGYQGKFVTKIESLAFRYNNEITSITIPGSVQTIEALSMEWGNHLEHITVAKDNPNYKSEQECLIEKETNTLVLGCKNSTIPNTVTAIGVCAFYNCGELTDITIPNGVTLIGGAAFKGCDGLAEITIPDSVISIDYEAYEGTAYYNDPSHWDSDGVLYIDGHLIKAKPTLAGAYTVRTGTKTIAAWAFSEALRENPEICLDLTSIVIPDSVVSIGWLAFGACTGLKELTIGSGVTNIETYEAVYEAVTEYGIAYWNAFTGCSGLEHIIVSDKNSVYKSEGECLIEKQTNELIFGCKNSVIPNGVTKIGEWAFGDCDRLTSVTIPNSVTSIGECAFYNCSGLTGELKIPDSVTSIGDYAFYGCNGLTSITIPASMTEIGSSAFYNCNKLVEVWNYSDLEIQKGDAGNGAVAYYAKHVYTVNEESKQTITNDGYIFYEDGEEVCLLGYRGSKTELVLPEKSPTGREYKIYQYAFVGRAEITSVTIGSGVTRIGEDAFYDCVGVETLYWNAINCAENGAFYYCKNLKTVIIGKGVVCLPTNSSNTFRRVESLTVDGDNPNYSSQDGILYNKTKTVLVFALKAIKGNVTIPDGVTSIGEEAFSWCSGLTSVTIGSGVTSIGEEAFSWCSGLTSVTIGSGVTSIGDYAFRGCGITDIQFQGTVEAWLAIEKGICWNFFTPAYTVTCTDGTVDREGNVTYFGE